MNTEISEIISTKIVKQNSELIWKKLVSFGGTEKFVPALIDKVMVKGSGLGAVRDIYLVGGGMISEELTKIDVKNHQLEFIILSTPMPVSEYTGTYKVVSKSDTSCEVTFVSHYKIASEDKVEMESVIKGFQETFLGNLHR